MLRIVKNTLPLTGESPIQGIIREALFLVGQILALLAPVWFNMPDWSTVVSQIVAIYAVVAGLIAKDLDIAESIESIGRKVLTLLSIVLVKFSGAVSEETWAMVNQTVLQVLGLISMFLPMIISKQRKEEKAKVKTLERQAKKANAA